MTVPNGSILRASARFNQPGYGNVINVWTMRCAFDTPQAEEDVFDAVDLMLQDVYGDFDQLMSADVDPLDLKVDVIEYQAGEWVVTANVGFGSWGNSISTGETADCLPPGAAVLGKLRTSLGKHWGRKWFGVFTELHNGDGFPSSTLTAAVLTGLSSYVGGYLFGMTQHLYGVVLDQQTGVVRDVIEAAVGSHWGYQRRRRPGVGS